MARRGGNPRLLRLVCIVESRTNSTHDCRQMLNPSGCSRPCSELKVHDRFEGQAGGQKSNAGEHSCTTCTTHTPTLMATSRLNSVPMFTSRCYWQAFSTTGLACALRGGGTGFPSLCRFFLRRSWLSCSLRLCACCSKRTISANRTTTTRFSTHWWGPAKG